FSSRRRHTRFDCDWSSDVCSSDLLALSRDYQEMVSLEAATRLGLPGQPLAAPPRVRLDLRWLGIKAWRRLRAAMVLASGGPLFRSEERRVGKECRSWGRRFRLTV